MDLDNSWTDAELTAVSIALEQEASRLRTGIAAAAYEYGSNVGDAINGTGGEVGDVGSLMAELTEGSSIASNEIDILHQYELALERIRTKTYGTCKGCEGPIDKARLMALPRATHCMTCKQGRLVH
ncbi:MAG: TraR/DksA C4-type zinc finger protein [Kineosporiaceae bacterium]|nr:TraR/DksA C4-type zinc finger protein [Aeromicrobium sp.]